MKQMFIGWAVACLATALSMPVLSAQDNQNALELGKKSDPTQLIACGNDCFFVLSEESFKVPGMAHSTLTSRTLRKFDAQLKPLWKNPIVIKKPGPKVFEGETVTLKTFVHTNPADGSTIEYLVANGECFQIRADGTLREIAVNMGKKEGRDKVAAIFVDAGGFNVLTMVGDETFPTGELNWYTWSHDKLAQTKRTIALPLPAGTDEDNESGWRLNKATPAGLYFYYVSYKNEKKDTSRPILACHVIHVGQDGKPGNILTLDAGVDEYSILPLGYAQEIYPDLLSSQPPLYNTGANSGRGYSIPTDNAYMGIQVDEQAQRIYTAVAHGKSVNGRVQMNLAGAKNIEYVQFLTFDLGGKLLSKSSKQPCQKHLSAYSVPIELLPLPTGEGMVCKLLDDDDGAIWVVNTVGEVTKQLKPKPLKFKVMTAPFTKYVFDAGYFSLKDFANSPYALLGKSKVYQFYQKQEDKAKRNTFYLSLKDKEILGTWDEKHDTFNLHSFTKTDAQL